MELGTIFYEKDYTSAYNYIKGTEYIIKEIEADEQGRRFQIVEKPKPSEKELIENEIYTLKEELRKWKEDVEQVELFGMVREDYEEKKLRCAEIILELRELEKQLEG